MESTNPYRWELEEVLRENGCEGLIYVEHHIDEWYYQKRWVVNELVKAEMDPLQKIEDARRLLGGIKSDVAFWEDRIANHNWYPYAPELHWLREKIFWWKEELDNSIGMGLEYPLEEIIGWEDEDEE